MLPLSGVRVIEFCQVAAGPFCGMLFADMGADVVKIEPPAGDTMRQWPPLTGGFSENFASLNRNKRSVVLDLKDPSDRDVAIALIATADILIENNRAGAMDRLGLGYEALKARFPRLIYCSISAFGQSGPRAKEGGFDVTIQAISGIMSVTGEEGGGPVKCGAPVSDFTAGLYAAFSVAAMLRNVQLTGEGGFVDIPMLGTSMAIEALQTSEYFGNGRDPKKLGSAHPRNAPYQAFRCGDSHIVIAAGNNKLWRDVCGIIGLNDLVDDPRYATTALRAKNQVALAVAVEACLANADPQTTLDRLAKAGVPCAPINSISEALADAQVVHAGWVEDLTLSNGTKTRTFGTPVMINGYREPVRQSPPELGSGTAEIRAEVLSHKDRHSLEPTRAAS
jgi:crotonobetainyl-CoA:carnitine CoA-transferase CaiB-like acyl-CoA transferase